MKKNKNIETKFTRKQNTDAGMALVLILLLIGYFTGNSLYFRISIPVLFIVMAVPFVLFPFSIVWFGVSNLLGSLMSKLLLTIIYFILVVPVGVFRKMAGKDTLDLSSFKKMQDSVFKTKDILFTAKEIEKPF